MHVYVQLANEHPFGYSYVLNSSYTNRIILFLRSIKSTINQCYNLLLQLCPTELYAHSEYSMYCLNLSLHGYI